MNNFYTLIYLIQEWKRTLTGTYFAEALSFRKNTLAIYFYSSMNVDSADEEVKLLTFSSAPQRTALFLDRYIQPKRLNSALFFNVLQGKRLLDIELAESDRYVRFIFEDGLTLIFLLYSNHANALLSQADQITEAFKRDVELVGKPVPLPVMATSSSVESGSPSRIMFAYQPLLPRTVVRHWLAIQSPEITETDDLQEAARRLDGMLRLKSYPHSSTDYGFSVLNPAVLGNDNAELFQSVNDGVAKEYYANVRAQEFVSKKAEIQKRLHRAREKLNRSLVELERLPQGLIKADQFEQMGHLLMANPHADSNGKDITVSDFYNNGESRDIPIDNSLSVVQNAEFYYNKAKSARLQYESSLQRTDQLMSKLERLQAVIESLEEVAYKRELDKWLKVNEALLRTFGMSGSAEQQIALSYRAAQVGKFEIRIGKSASANDELLRISHKEDVWLHARGVSGSHVIISMGKSTSMPPKSVIEAAAQYAAFFSKGKGSSLHPVIFTKRKYVRKPKGAAPGAVRVDREEVILVTPSEPDFSNKL